MCFKTFFIVNHINAKTSQKGQWLGLISIARHGVVRDAARFDGGRGALFVAGVVLLLLQHDLRESHELSSGLEMIAV